MSRLHTHLLNAIIYLHYINGMGTNITPVQTCVPSFPLLGTAMAATSSALRSCDTWYYNICFFFYKETITCNSNIYMLLIYLVCVLTMWIKSLSSTCIILDALSTVKVWTNDWHRNTFKCILLVQLCFSVTIKSFSYVHVTVDILQVETVTKWLVDKYIRKTITLVTMYTLTCLLWWLDPSRPEKFGYLGLQTSCFTLSPLVTFTSQNRTQNMCYLISMSFFCIFSFFF
jgi:hypothetical protein